MIAGNPILNNPYQEPKRHYATDPDGNLNYDDIRKGRRIFTPDIQVLPIKQGPQSAIFEVNDLQEEYGNYIINLIRREIGKWRDADYPNTTRVSRELLIFWFKNPERPAEKKLFFAQQEAIETGIWLNEIAERSNVGQHILNEMKSAEAETSLPRIAFKMATGTGKTVVMGALILYHFFNRQEYRNDTRFSDYFLVLAPGITIRDRLGVLFVDTLNKNINEIQDYYRIRRLVPKNMEQKLASLNSRIVITNYHAFEAKILQGNKRSPFDGKISADGKKREEREDYHQVMRRLLGKFKSGSRLLVLNDEAHHCYLPKEEGKNTDEEKSADENKRAALWHTGLTEAAKHFKIRRVYDLSATPYYLQGSGYQEYTLFPWTVSDFGLIEAIESGLVKIPFMPESDNTQELSMPVLRNLYEHVKKELPKKGRKTLKKETKESNVLSSEHSPKLPDKVKAALDQFYNHYKKSYEGEGKTQRRLFDDAPPVFIVVCNNTSVSGEVYKFIAGYDLSDEDGKIIGAVPGHYELFSNFDRETQYPLRKPPTLLIDSDALENSNQINAEFKKVFAREIENFRQDYRIAHPDKSAENISESDILARGCQHSRKARHSWRACAMCGFCINADRRVGRK